MTIIFRLYKLLILYKAVLTKSLGPAFSDSGTIEAANQISVNPCMKKKQTFHKVSVSSSVIALYLHQSSSVFYQHVSTTGKKNETDHYLRKKLGKADSTAITAVPFGLPSRRT